MAFTSGFFNALNHDRLYDAEQISSMFDGVITDGVFTTIGDCFTVTADTNDLNVKVGSGRCWFDHVWCYCDGNHIVAMEPAETALDRIDAVCIEINHTLAVREGRVVVVKGEPSSTPQRPPMTHTDEVDQYPLVYISRPMGSTEVDTGMMTNMVGTTECPFVTRLLETTEISTLIDGWQAQWDIWYDDAVNNAGAALTNFMVNIRKEFYAWFDFLKEMTNGNPVTNFANQFYELKTNGGRAMLYRDHEYKLGDIAYSNDLPSWTYLTCVQAGTTAHEKPEWISNYDFFKNQYPVGGAAGTDGTVQWVVSDMRPGQVFIDNQYKPASLALAKVASDKADYIQDALGGLRFVVDEDGNFGYVKPGGDPSNITPFKLYNDLGVGSSFDVSNFANFRNFTVDNFICEPAAAWSASAYWTPGSLTASSMTGNLNKSYDPVTGIFTCSAGGVLYGGNQSYPETATARGYGISLHVWLVITA